MEKNRSAVKCKKILFLGMTMGLLLLCACTQKEKETVELTVIHGWGSTEGDHVAMREIYKDFEKNHPDIVVNQVSMPSGNELLRKVEDMLMVGKVPDVIFLSGMGKDSVYEFMVENDLALDLMPYLEEDDTFRESLAPVNLEYWETEEGELFTVSDVLLFSGGYWYNREIFQNAGVEEVPETWEEFLEACEKIDAWAKKEKNRVKCFEIPDEGYLYFADHLLAQKNMVQAWDARLDSSGFEKSKLRETLEDMKEIYHYSSANANSYGYRDATDQFNQGMAAMYINGTWGAFMISDKLDVDYALLPCEEGSSMSCVSACLGYMLGNTRDEQKEEAGVEFLKYMLSDEVQKRILRETAQMPANPNISLEENGEGMSRFLKAVSTVQNADYKIEVPDNVWDSYQKNVFTDLILDVLGGKMDTEVFIDLLKQKQG